jgi:hypothetical protein
MNIFVLNIDLGEDDLDVRQLNRQLNHITNGWHLHKTQPSKLLFKYKDFSWFLWDYIQISIRNIFYSCDLNIIWIF